MPCLHWKQLLSLFWNHFIPKTTEVIKRKESIIMKIVIAIDSFKGSLTSIDAGNTIKSSILKIKPEAEIIVKPLADGGEGRRQDGGACFRKI